MSPGLRVAFVNNMPDAAVAATEAQFTRLLHQAAPGVSLQLRRYAIANVPRSEAMRRKMARSYEDVAALYARGADLLIVTGAEPRAERLDAEPYWEDVSRLVQWARGNTLGVLWSCLAAHLAVQAMDGVPRQRAETKFSGVYACDVVDRDWAFDGAGAQVKTPHSRYNGLAPSDLESCGYRIASSSDEIGVDCFWRREPSLFLFTQGHPEYDADTLAREFRRDALRFCEGSSGSFPQAPAHYLASVTQQRLAELRTLARALAPREFTHQLNQMLAQERLEATWAEDAARLYRNWLAAATAGRALNLRSA
jgi:homoserine O-succinyltransferase